MPPSRARLLTVYEPQAWYGAGQFFAPNPDFGAAIEYYLRDAAKEEMRVSVSDSRGNPVRTLRGGRRAGLNRVSWDLRMDPPAPENARDAPPVSGFSSATPGPLVVPGTYTVTVTGAGRLLKGELRVEGDPRSAFSDTDRRSRQTTLLNLYGLQKSLVAARAAMAAASNQRDVMSGLLPLQVEISTELNLATTLSRAIEGYSGLPTADQRRQLDWLFDDASKTVDALNRVLQSDMHTPARPR